jgi:putative transposase
VPLLCEQWQFGNHVNPRPRKTRRSWNEPGHAHFLTFSCYRRWPLLTKDRSRRWVIESFQSVRRTQNVALWAYVIMPEHVHLLLCPRNDNYDMRRILAALKRPVAAAARAYLEENRDERWLRRLSTEYPSRRVFRFWQPGDGFDHNIFREKTIPAVIDYIHLNPIRRGLVDDPTNWIWSSARFWNGSYDVPIAMDHPFD